MNNIYEQTVYDHLPEGEIQGIYELITKPRMSDNNQKGVIIARELSKHGYVLNTERDYLSGTNRAVFVSKVDPRVVLKIALDRYGMRDNLSAMENSQDEFLDPFIAITIDTDTHGVISIAERVDHFTRAEQYNQFQHEIYQACMYVSSQYIIDDAGPKSFMNWGLKDGRVVCLDHAYWTRFDGDAIECDDVDCFGHYVYDDLISHVYCNECGKKKKLEAFRRDYLKSKNMGGFNSGDYNDNGFNMAGTGDESAVGGFNMSGNDALIEGFTSIADDEDEDTSFIYEPVGEGNGDDSETVVEEPVVEEAEKKPYHDLSKNAEPQTAQEEVQPTEGEEDDDWQKYVDEANGDQDASAHIVIPQEVQEAVVVEPQPEPIPEPTPEPIPEPVVKEAPIVEEQQEEKPIFSTSVIADNSAKIRKLYDEDGGESEEEGFLSIASKIANSLGSASVRDEDYDEESDNSGLSGIASKIKTFRFSVEDDEE